jgi:hypothetical protein
MASVQESATSATWQGSLRLGSGMWGCLLHHATISKRQGGQEHRDIQKRYSLNKCRGLPEKDLQTAFTNASVTTSVLLELIANRKTVLGAHDADHEKMVMTEVDLAQAHTVLDAKRLTMVNRTVVYSLHDGVYPNASETPATIKLRSILKTPEVTKILQGEKLTTESLWSAQPCRFRRYTHVRSTGVQV